MKKLLTWVALMLVAGAVQAQPWPAKPVHVIVNVAPGGVADVTARVLSARLTETLGQPIVIENKAGGGGYIGFEALLRNEADGYNFIYAPGATVMVAPHVLDRPDLDPLKVLTPVVPTGRVSLYVMSHPSAPFDDYKSFLAYARAHPGKLHYGSAGNGTSPHIAAEVFKREAKVQITHVPYKGAGPALKDLLGGVTHLAFDPGVGLAPAKAGKLRLIAIAGPQRHPDFPNVPTLEENGIEGVDGGPHFGFYAKAGTPRAAIDRLNRAVIEAMQAPAVNSRFKALAVDIAEPMTPEQFATYVKTQHARYAKLIPELGIKR